MLENTWKAIEERKTGEMLKADIKTSTKWLRRMFGKIWAEEDTLSEWSRVILISIMMIYQGVPTDGV
jgi:hypothetical protein